MAKTLHTRRNKIFLKMLRELRESRGLRQTDLADLLGHSQATVSNVERGERRLDVIELRDWLDALNGKFADFTSKLDDELLRLGGPRLRIVHPKGIEGHVPAREIKRLLKEKPTAIGLAVPGMPLGSPGMDGPDFDNQTQPYDVLLVLKDGSTRVYQSYFR